MNKKISLLSNLLLISFFSCSCLPAVIGGAATATTSALEERSIGDQLDDNVLKFKIKKAFLNSKDANIRGLEVKISEGRILLTGKVAEQESRIEAIKLTWQQEGVKEVIDEITVSTERLPLKQVLIDNYITSQVKAKMLLEDKIKSINYNIETINGVVYILGIAQDYNELEKVTNLVSKIKNVKKVVNYARVKNDELRQMSKMHNKR